MKIEEVINKIICGDAIEELKRIPDNSINTIITSPPYNKGYFGKRVQSKHDVWKQRNIEYGEFKDNLEWEDYEKQQTDVLEQMVRVIKPDGSIFYNHKGQPNKHKLYFPEWVFRFNVRQVIIWDRGSTPVLMPIRWYPTTEYIFWITKTAIQPKFYRRGKYDKEVWRINPKPMKEHPAPFPEELVAQCLISTTDEQDIVLDPYFGSGTVGVVATKLKRRFVGIEINKKYIEWAEERIRTTTMPLL